MLKIIICVAAVVSLTGCATITRGTTSQLQIISDPSGADVRTTLGQTCVTPCTLTVSRKDEFSVSFSAPGYEPASVSVRSQIAGAGAAGVAGNLLFGGIIGVGVDAASGATLEHVPNPVNVTLRPLAKVQRAPLTPRRPARVPISSARPLTTSPTG